MLRSQGVLVLVAALAVAPKVVAQANRWATPKCDLKPGHRSVNSGMMYLKSATETRFEDQRQKDLRDASNALLQALTGENQAQNPAAWYYLGRYYILVQDFSGADSALARAEALRPECQGDIATWRRLVWVPTLNAGIAAWQANNTDSAMAAFRRANTILQTEPMGFSYLASLLFNAGQHDSAALYFRRAADIAATDTARLQDRKDALYNVGRIQHSLQHWPEAERAYREFLTLNPRDPEILASLGAVLLQTGQRDSAFGIYERILGLGDSVGSFPMFRAGVEIFQSAPEPPDTVAAGRTCRAQGRTNRPATPARIRACRDSMTTLMREHNTVANGAYRLAAQAFETGVKLNPYFRDGLFNLVNAYMALNDSAAMLAPAQRLVTVDPLNRMSLRLLAFTYQRLGRLDSTLHYLRIADSTLIADVTVSGFDPQDQTATVKGLITNMRATPSQPFTLMFDFLNAKGEAVTSQTVAVPTLAPQGTQAIDLKASGASIVAWRYRKG
ncbi:MAG: tetratricopeptide repeat protein [Gemmatimonadales bacterium]